MTFALQPALTDAQVASVIPGCQRGEAAAIEALYDLYADRLYRYLLARTGDADAAAELTTEVFVRVLSHVQKFCLNTERPAASVSAWLYRIAGNLVTDYHRSARHRSAGCLDDVEPVASAGTDPQQVAESREMSVQLAEALETLTEEQRLVVIGKFVEDLSNLEIASSLGKTEGAVKSMQHRALRTLGRWLRAEGS